MCFACDTLSPLDAFTTVKRKTVIGQCAHCGKEVSFASSSSGVVGPLCSSIACSNYVAVAHANSFLQPHTVLDPGWNRGLQSRLRQLAPGLLFARCRSGKDFVTLRVLQVLAKQDDARLNFANPQDHSSLLCLDAKRQKYIGFLIWSEGESPVLRQLFVVKNERRKGYASEIVRFWVARYASKSQERFGIEGPNDAALALHVKLGHIKIEGSSMIGVKCYFAPTF